jgi:uncharacterized membrane protein
MMTNDNRIDKYLEKLRAALKGMTLAEREDIIDEIHMHIRERAGEELAGVEIVLAGLGPAEKLAEQYRTGLLLQHARRSISPLVILRATMRWARTGVEGFAVFLIALLGYAAGVGFLVLALLKPIFPDRTGLWVGPGVFEFTFRMGLKPSYYTSSVHEVLGWWFLPVCLIIGSLSMLATTKAIQLLTKRFHWRVPAEMQNGMTLTTS